MVGTGRWVAVGLAFSMGLATSPVAAFADRPSVVVHVDNRAGIPQDHLLRARTELEDVFRAAGVDVLWSQDGLIGSIIAATGPVDRRHVVVMLVGTTTGKARGATASPLGLAIPPRSMAYVFYKRIVAESRSQPVDGDVILGRVIAHEVGHLIMPLRRHAHYGIMRASLDVAVTNPNRFTDDEARTIRADLVARSRIN